MSNTYSNVLNSNAEMLKKAEIMYEADQTALSLAKGQGIDEIERQRSLQAINNKLNMLREEKAKALAEKEKEYTRDTKVLAAIEDNQQKSDIILKKQEKEMTHNYNQIDDMKGNILTMRRQVEISMDETLRRNNKVFLLKLLFVYLLCSVIPLILAKNGMITPTISAIVMAVLTAIYILANLWNVYQTRNRNPLRYTLRQFTKPSVSDILKNEQVSEEDKKVEEEQKKANDPSTLCERLVKELKKLKQQALDDEDYCVAGSINNMLKRIAQARAENKPYCGYSSTTEIANMIKQLKSSKAAADRKQKALNEQQVQDLQQSIKSQKLVIKELKKTRKTYEEDEKHTKKNLKDAEKLLDKMKDRLDKIWHKKNNEYQGNTRGTSASNVYQDVNSDSSDDN